jgi:deoxyuridine 5'-triphosphate nucleotidohydrolase
MLQEDDNPPKPCYYSKDFEYANLPNYNLRKPNSRCCYKREIALRHTFQDIAYAEDDDWGMRASNDIQKECIIDEALYFYDFKSKPQNWFWTKKMRHEHRQDEDDYLPNEIMSFHSTQDTITMSHDIHFQCCRKHPDAVLPTKAGKDEVGYDLTLISVHKNIDRDTVMFDTGLVVKPPPHYYIEIVPRSSIIKKGWMLANSIGVIDPTYRDTLKVVLKRVHDQTPDIELPSKLCQLIVRRIYLPNSSFIEVESLDETERKGGFGSTDHVDSVTEIV